jgi:peptidoglycan hydrolase-like protein with peptidoglycan-binding domain
MLSVRACLTIVLGAALAAAPAYATRTHRAATSGHGKTTKHAKKTKSSHVVRGQRGIDGDRAREIQTALIREKYMTGEPSGQWDDETQAAMEKYQSDHGWQTKLTPDSRALIKLGLGPNHDADTLTAAGTGTPQAAAEPELPAGMSNTLAAVHSSSN